MANSGLDFRISPVHTSVPGRARLRIAGLQDRPGLKNALESSLAGKDGIRSVSASTVTSNLLVYYDPERPLPEVIGTIRITIHSLGGPQALAGFESRPRNRAPGLLRSLWTSLKAMFRPGDGRPEPPAASGCIYAVPERMAEAWHAVEARQVAHFWDTSPHRGLSTAAAQERLRNYGPNVLPLGPVRSPLRMLAGQFQSLPVALLLGSAVLSIATGGLADAAVIGAVVVLNAGIGFFTELQAERTIQSLISLAEPLAIAIRDGVPRKIGGERVVPGDVLVLARGAHVVADARLLDSDGLTVDESALTGESAPSEKSADRLCEDPLPLAGRFNMVYRGTVVTGGSGFAVVVATGSHTEMGRVQALIAESTPPETPLQGQMRTLSGQLAWFTGAVAAAVFGVGLLRGYSPLEMLKSAVSLAVAAVPEGLPAIATFALANGVRALLAHKVLVRRLSAVETLGGVQVMCFDKTGTLTLNQMAVVAASIGMKRYTVAGGDFFHERKPLEPFAQPEMRQVFVVSALCNEAEVRYENGAPIVEGTATEAALVRMALNAGVDVRAMRAQFPLLKTVHRREAQNYMITEHEAGGGRLLAMKGNPLEVLALSGFYRRDGAVVPLTEADRKQVRMENERMAGAALRVLGLAYAESPDGEPKDGGFVWLGLVGIADPPREGLREVIQQFRTAGVKPVMVTGDQRATAEAVARTLGLQEGNGSRVLDSTQLDQLDRREWTGILPRAEIFARVSPAHKLQIVQAFQRERQVVAMTGDGVNDGPALRAADVGIALGQGGTRVAREVADLILLDDNIQAMLPAIREARRVREGLRKAVHYISATNLSEVVVMLTAITTGMGPPFNPRQLLWINLISDVFPELALAVEPAHTDLMCQPPRDARLPVAGRADYGRLGAQGLVMSGSALAGYAAGLARYGAGPQASAMAFITLAAAQLLHGISARSEHRSVLDMGKLPPNRHLAAGLGAGFAVLALSQVAPGLSALLGTARIGLLDAVVCAAAALASFGTIEALKSRRSTELLPAPA